MIISSAVPWALGGTKLFSCVLIPKIKALVETLTVAQLVWKYPTIYMEPVIAMLTKHRHWGPISSQRISYISFSDKLGGCTSRVNQYTRICNYSPHLEAAFSTRNPWTRHALVTRDQLNVHCSLWLNDCLIPGNKPKILLWSNLYSKFRYNVNCNTRTSNIGALVKYWKCQIRTDWIRASYTNGKSKQLWVPPSL